MTIQCNCYRFYLPNSCWWTQLEAAQLH